MKKNMKKKSYKFKFFYSLDIWAASIKPVNSILELFIAVASKLTVSLNKPLLRDKILNVERFTL